MVFSVPIPAYAAETTADEIVSAMTEREKIKAAGKPCVLVSIDKPYDVANYPDADTMLAVYGSSGMDPTEGGVRPATNYGPNIPAALDVIFGAYQPVGTLPVNIPVIQDGVMSTTETQYERGGGLTGDLTRVGRRRSGCPIRQR